MVSNGDFMGPGAFKVACNIISQLNFIILRVRFKFCFYSQEYRITISFRACAPACAILSEQIGWLLIRCDHFIL